jgi:hypothetical protein
VASSTVKKGEGGQGVVVVAYDWVTLDCTGRRRVVKEDARVRDDVFLANDGMCLAVNDRFKENDIVFSGDSFGMVIGCKCVFTKEMRRTNKRKR